MIVAPLSDLLFHSEIQGPVQGVVKIKINFILSWGPEIIILKIEIVISITAS